MIIYLFNYLLRHYVQKGIFLKRHLYRKHFVSNEESNCIKEIHLTQQDRIANINYANVDVSVNQWLHLLKVSASCFGKNPGARVASRHSAFMDNCSTIVIHISHICLVD